MIKYEDARTELNNLRCTESPNNIVQVKELYNTYIINDNDVIASKDSRNINNLVWYMELSKVYMSKKDLFEDAQNQVVSEGYLLTEGFFKEIDQEVKLSRFDYPSAFHIVCKRVREEARKEENVKDMMEYYGLYHEQENIL